MSKTQIKTVNDLIDKLDYELAWRKKEIVQANLLIDAVCKIKLEKIKSHL